MPQDLAERISRLSPGALRLFKQQLATLPESSRQIAFSRLSGIPELSDIVGRPTPVPTQPQVEEEKKWWQYPLEWIRNVETGAGTLLAAPFTPAVPGTEQLPWWQRERAEYEAWEEPSFQTEPLFRLPWTPQEIREEPWTIGVKGALEMAPWLATTAATMGLGGIAGLGARTGIGALTKAAQVGQRAMRPVLAAERAAAYPITKPLGVLRQKAITAVAPKKIWGQLAEPERVMLGRSAGLSERVASKTWADMTAVEKKAISSRVLRPPAEVPTTAAAPEVGIPMPPATQKGILEMAGTGRPGLSGEAMGLVYRNPQGKPIAVATLHPEPSGAIRIGSVVADEKSLLKGKAAKAILGELEKTPNVILPPTAEMSPMGLKIAEKFQQRVARRAMPEVPPELPPVKPVLTTPAIPAGFKVTEQEAVTRLTGLFGKEARLIKETRALRKPVRSARIAHYSAALEAKIAEGVPAKEAHALAKEALAGKYPVAEITPQMERLLLDVAKDEKILFDMVVRAEYASEFTRVNTFEALQKLLLLENLAPFQLRLLEETFGSELVKKLLNLRPWTTKAWELSVDIANAPRALLASCDISGLLCQGAILFARRPIEGIQTVRPMLYAMFRDKNAVLVDSIIRARPFMEQALHPNLKVPLELTAIPSKEIAMLTQFEEAFASKVMNKIPFVRASNRAFVTVLNDMRSRSVTSTLRNWNKAGLRFNNKLDYWKTGGTEYGLGDISDLNQLVNWASGRGTLPKALQKQGKLLNALIFAPKFQMAHLQFPTAILPMVTKSALARREAWQEMLSFVGAGAGILTMAQLSGAHDIELNPRSADFGKLRVGETRLDIWSGYAQYIRFVANLATGQKKSVGGRTYAVSRKDVIDRFARTKFSPAMGLLSDLLVGETYMGEDLPPKSVESVAGQMWERMVPMAIQGMVDAYSQEGPIGLLIGSAELLGIGAVTYTNEVKRARDKATKAQYGMSWEELGRQYGRAAQLRLEQTTPAILEAEREQEKRFATGSPTITEQWQNEGQGIEDTYREEITLATKEYRQTRDGVRFRERVNNASSYKRNAYASRAKREEYQDIIAYYNQPLEPDKLAKMNPGDVLRREYYQQMFNVDMYDEFGNYRFEEAERREQEFVKKHGQQALDYIEEYRGLVWVDKPTELKTLEYAKEILRPYWRIADSIWAMYSPQLKDLSDQIQILERTNPELARRILRSYPQILRARELIAQYRKMTREQNPMINQAYRMYYMY